MSPPSLVDLNQYNLALEDIAQEWTAVITGETAMMNAGARLAAKSSKEIFVDTIQVKFPRQSGGLGLELLEIAGGTRGWTWNCGRFGNCGGWKCRQ